MKKLIMSGLLLLSSLNAYSDSNGSYHLKVTPTEKNHMFIEACWSAELRNCLKVGPEAGVYLPALKKLQTQDTSTQDMIDSLLSLNGKAVSAEELVYLDSDLSSLEEEHSEIYSNLAEHNKELEKFRNMDSPMSFVQFGKHICGEYMPEEFLLKEYESISTTEAMLDFKVPRSVIKDHKMNAFKRICQ